MNNSGKVLTVFLVIIAILLISLTAISMFLFQKEHVKREAAESERTAAQAQAEKLSAELKESQKKLVVLEKKNMDMDEKNSDLLDELDVEQGINEELKLENQTLKEALDSATGAQEKLRNDFETELQDSRVKIDDLEQKLSDEMKRTEELERVKEELQSRLGITDVNGISSKSDPNQIKLDTIVVASGDPNEGRVLSVDPDNGFIIISLGEKDGVLEGETASIYRSEEHLGDAKITRVQPEMSAADFVPPLTGQSVRKNDVIRIKK